VVTFHHLRETDPQKNLGFGLSSSSSSAVGSRSTSTPLCCRPLETRPDASRLPIRGSPSTRTRRTAHGGVSPARCNRWPRRRARSRKGNSCRPCFPSTCPASPCRVRSPCVPRPRPLGEGLRVLAAEGGLAVDHVEDEKQTRAPGGGHGEVGTAGDKAPAARNNGVPKVCSATGWASPPTNLPLSTETFPRPPPRSIVNPGKCLVGS
jgi:hypothetical protein